MPELVASRIQQLRQHLNERRGEIRALHDAGSTGTQVVAALTVLADGAVDRLVRAAIEELSSIDAGEFESGMALVALGGYGRAELAPYSDIDLMFLYHPAARRVAETLCNRLVRDVWDVGLVLGSSMRTLAECISLARSDISVHTALLDARQVVGNPWLTGELHEQLARLTRGGRAGRFVAAALAERATEQARFGSTVHLLNPDVKKSKGGLRELHLMGWIAHLRHGVASIDRLERDGLIAAEDATLLLEAREFLLRVRNDLHFQAGRAQDMMTLEEQVRLAAVFGYRERPGLLAVEQFMQQYYRHCGALDDITRRFVNRYRAQSIWRRLARSLSSKRLGGEYLVSGNEIIPVPTAQAAVLSSLERIVYLFLLANRSGLAVADAAREQIRTAAARLELSSDAPALRTFLDLLGEPGHLAQTLHHLHALGILEILIPEFAHARGLIQFNQYHKYTVDEHSLLCVANAEKLFGDAGPLGQVYRDIHHKEILHLALLLHDLGKGFEVDHSELGREIALRTAERFALEPHLRDVLVFLVRQHLLMAHLAFRRDTSDEQLLARFARQVGTAEVLKMLFVFTAADIASVGPETWTSWKGDVLADLYARTIEKLTGDVPTLNPEQEAAAVRERVARMLAGSVSEDWLRPHLEAMTWHYLRTTPVERIVEHLRTISTLPVREVVTTAVYETQTGITAYTIYTFDQITPGLFSKIAGVLAARGLQILGAQITTHRDGVVVDRFEVIDLDFDDEPPASRLDYVASTIRQVLLGHLSIETLAAQAGRIGPRHQRTPETFLEPTQVQIDNDTSDRFTIIEVFANDRQGLLYIIARTIFELGLSVSLAKISTSLDQVLDVFYLTDLAANKVTDEPSLNRIRERLVDAIEQFEAAGRPTSVT